MFQFIIHFEPEATKEVKEAPLLLPRGGGKSVKHEAMPSGWHSPPLGEDGRGLYLL